MTEVIRFRVYIFLLWDRPSWRMERTTGNAATVFRKECANGALPPLSNPFKIPCHIVFSLKVTSLSPRQIEDFDSTLKLATNSSPRGLLIHCYSGFFLCLQPDAAPGCDSGLASDDADLVLMSSSELGDGDKWMTSTTFDRYLYKLEAEQNRQGCQLGISSIANLRRLILWRTKYLESRLLVSLVVMYQEADREDQMVKTQTPS